MRVSRDAGWNQSKEIYKSVGLSNCIQNRTNVVVVGLILWLGIKRTSYAR